MIENNSVLNKKDFIEVAKFRKFSPMNIVLSLFYIGMGIYLLSTIRLLLPAFVLMFPQVSISLTLSTFGFPLFGLLFIIYGLCHVRFGGYLLYKKNKFSLSRNIKFTEEEVTVEAQGKGMGQHNSFEYSSFTHYYERNNSLFIEIAAEKQRLYLIVHDDGYVSGSKEDAIRLLESKGVTKK